MKKLLLAFLLLIVPIFALTACGGNEDADPEVEAAGTEAEPTDGGEEFVTVTDLRGETIENVPVNPTTVAIYDYGVLDMLYRAGWENTGIELVVIPSKDTLPEALSWFGEQPNETVVNGGTLHWVDWDVLDMAQPELVITGQRSFAMDDTGERLEPEDRTALWEETEERYSETAFVHLGQDVERSQVENMEVMVEALSQIFPEVADYLTTSMDDFETEIAEVREEIEGTEATAMVVTLHTPFEFSVDIGAGMRTNVVFDTFGFTPPTAEGADNEMLGAGDASTELVLRINPDVIYVLPHSALEDPSSAISNFINDATIQMTDAAINGNIIELQGAPWHVVTTGFTGMEAMINDVSQFLSN